MKRAIIIGDTRGYHLGSLLSCTSLMRLARRRYHLLGVHGGTWFRSHSYAEFVRKAKRWEFLGQAAAAEVVLCNGEGLLEPGSPYGSVFFHLARFLRAQEVQDIRLVNFTCTRAAYGDWRLFDALVPRDAATYALLWSRHSHCTLGFDSSVLTPFHAGPRPRRTVVLFRGRKNIPAGDRARIQRAFPQYTIVMASCFTPFRNADVTAATPAVLSRLLRGAELVVSSSFHGIVASARMGTPFIPLETVPVAKNGLLSADLLGPLFATRTLDEWLGFYQSEENRQAVRVRLRRVLPQCIQRAKRNVV